MEDTMRQFLFDNIKVNVASVLFESMFVIDSINMEVEEYRELAKSMRSSSHVHYIDPLVMAREKVEGRLHFITREDAFTVGIGGFLKHFLESVNLHIHNQELEIKILREMLNLKPK